MDLIRLKNEFDYNKQEEAISMIKDDIERFKGDQNMYCFTTFAGYRCVLLDLIYSNNCCYK